MSLSQKDLLLSGSFSETGKLLLSQFYVINQAEKMKKKRYRINRKYFMIPKFDSPSYDENNTLIHNSNFMFKKISQEEDNQKDKDNSSNDSINENENKQKKLFQGENYKYYNLHQEKLKFDKKFGLKDKKNEPSFIPVFSKTNNNYLKKIKLGLKWNNMTGRKSQKIFEDKKYINILEYKNKKNIEYKKVNTNENRCFIDMSKQTERNGFPLSNDLRLRCEKKFIPINKKIAKEKWIKFCKKSLIGISPFSIHGKFSYRGDSTLNLKKKGKKILREKKSLSERTTPRNINIKKPKNNSSYLRKNNSALYFNKTNKIKFFKTYESRPICVLYPNYNSIEERVKMMVTYKSQKSLFKKKNEFKGINLIDLYDPNKSYEKIYGHKLSHVPNFEKMISRPKNDEFPSFMQGLYNGMSSCFNIQNNLILNNFTERKNYEEKNKIKRKKMINKFIKSKKQNTKKKDASKDMLQKFNNLYIEFCNKTNKK